MIDALREAVERGRRRIESDRAAGIVYEQPTASQSATLIAMAEAGSPRRHMRSLCRTWGFGGGSADLDVALALAVVVLRVTS